MKNIHDENPSHFPRLDILDSILQEHISPEFLDFVWEHPNAFALVVLGAIQCGVTRPHCWDDLSGRLEAIGSEVIDDYINWKLEQSHDH